MLKEMNELFAYFLLNELLLHITGLRCLENEPPAVNISLRLAHANAS